MLVLLNLHHWRRSVYSLAKLNLDLSGAERPRSLGLKSLFHTLTRAKSAHRGGLRSDY